MMIKRNFLKNALFVSAVCLTMNTVGILFRTYVSNRIGAEAMGLLQLILSVYYPACTFAASGINVASTRLNAEALARADRHPRQILRKCTEYALCFGTVAFVILFFGADFFAGYLLKNAAAALPLKILAFGLPFLSTANALQGFFLALRKASASTFLQVTEDVSKVASTILLFGAFLGKGTEAALCAMVGGMAMGEILSCLCGLWYCRRKLSLLAEPKTRNTAPVFPEILRIALPCAFSAYLRSGLSMTENILIPRGLGKAGLTEEQTLAALGKIEGMALPVLMFPATFLTVVSRLLVPEITAEHAVGKDRENRSTIRAVLRWTLTYACFLALFAVFFGQALGKEIYHDPTCGKYMILLSPLIPILYCDSVTDGMMKGYNRQLTTMKINLTDAALRTAATLWILPYTGIAGYIGIMIGGAGFNLCLSIRALMKASGARFPFVRGIVLPFGTATAVLLPIRYLFEHNAVSLPAAGVISAGIYAGLIFAQTKIRIRFTLPSLRKASGSDAPNGRSEAHPARTAPVRGIPPR